MEQEPTGTRSMSDIDVLAILKELRQIVALLESIHEWGVGQSKDR